MTHKLSAFEEALRKTWNVEMAEHMLTMIAEDGMPSLIFEPMPEQERLDLLAERRAEHEEHWTVH